MKLVFSFAVVLLASAANTFTCPRGSTGECCLSPVDIQTVCVDATFTDPSASIPDYQCSSKSMIARTPRCCVKNNGDFYCREFV
ncbi:uncharacterized protein K444DRAFT_204303 [Hyaloscypha bicolor E]|uniref:Hydrophobin 2 n=1 Tax=Hyaloscypha bicolor E TaxID=1095630 RepID=A0A2J6TNW2_9HELO|nr:uncharacterized protein K444DRAFT_204303 [Hyaloscypha bicolor E]PMD64699.1 hypothetical protein K444DRAFT_204303 [Hyaloscypha bicolor E]